MWFERPVTISHVAVVAFFQRFQDECFLSHGAVFRNCSEFVILFSTQLKTWLRMAALRTCLTDKACFAYVSSIRLSALQSLLLSVVVSQRDQSRHCLYGYFSQGASNMRLRPWIPGPILYCFLLSGLFVTINSPKLMPTGVSHWVSHTSGRSDISGSMSARLVFCILYHFTDASTL